MKTKLSNGTIIYGKNVSGFGGRGIYVKRDKIEPEYEHLDKFLEPSNVLVDIGANTGIYSLKAAKNFSTGKGAVVSVEPFLDVLMSLFKSMQANGFTNMRLRNACIGAETGTTQLWKNFNRPHSFSLLQIDEQATCISVLAVSLDDLFRWENLDRLDYLKVDVEGVEDLVIRGGRKTIEKFRPIIQMEITLGNATIDLQNYSVYEAPDSPNKFCIPNEHPKSHVPRGPCITSYGKRVAYQFERKEFRSCHAHARLICCRMRISRIRNGIASNT